MPSSLPRAVGLHASLTCCIHHVCQALNQHVLSHAAREVGARSSNAAGSCLRDLATIGLYHIATTSNDNPSLPTFTIPLQNRLSLPEESRSLTLFTPTRSLTS
ncbi:hypothetical protein BDZ85DRAFT_106066 [Elsinoe ampelina]|uniref:Uncharacterized protein n=1 Tax=Elsinoe ampelina TaxID=302913 RepID=A0A6A6FXU0_9PEZI|nr:hypothetical protein BDZ85DRAFT_106066 [Elsinoe ampelina]